MGRGISKPFAEIAGVPMLYYSLMALERSPSVSQVIVVTRAEGRDRLCGCAYADRFTKLKKTVLGGPLRQDSVLNGLMAVDPNADAILIHDAARPMLHDEWVEIAIDALTDCAGVIFAMPLTDTLKRADKDGLIKETVNREGLFTVQTPQVFKTEWIMKAHEHRKAERLVATDDASLVESIGGKVKMLPGYRSNIKVTYPEDLMILERLMSGRAREWFGSE
ncbi:2-C-methyl-D-erythritol 4-phosphate cytidylyltransferase [bacterium]|nr:2-C-methyl-D-erythritol 4-phosphate cytidylyltransferase [bacterium]